MRFLYFILGALIIGFTLQGCGGSNSGAPASPYTGNYTGTFSTTDPQSGTITIIVAPNGGITGYGHNNTTAKDLVLSGSVTKTGTAYFVFTYSGSTISATGTVGFDSPGNLVGTLPQYTGTNDIGANATGTNVTINVTLQP